MLLIFLAVYVGQEGLTRTPFAIKGGQIDVETGKSVIQLSDDDPFVVGVILNFLYGSRFPDDSNGYDGGLNKKCGSIDDLARVYVTLDKYNIPGLKENLLGFLEIVGETFFELLPYHAKYFQDLAKAFETITGAHSVEDKFSQFLIDLVKELSTTALDAEMQKLRCDLFGRIASQSIERGQLPSPKRLTMASFFSRLPLWPSFQSVWTWSLGR